MTVFFIVLLLSIFSFSVYGQNFKSKILFRTATYNLYDVCKAPGSSVWAIGTPHFDHNTLSYQSTVLFSNDLGLTWEKKNVPVAGKFTSVYFFSGTHGWICGENGIILKTIDSGNSWRSNILDQSFKINDIFFINENTGFAVGHNGSNARIWKTENGGESWLSQRLPVQLKELNSVKFFDHERGWICGSKSNCGTILYTNDGGITWSVQFDTPQNMTFTSIFFADDAAGWAAGVNSDGSSGSTMFKTENGGSIWTSIALQHKFHALHFIDKNRGLAGGIPSGTANGPKLMKTVDGGITWDELTVKPHTGENIYGVWANENSFIAVGYRSLVCTGQPWNNTGVKSNQIQDRLSFNSIYFKDENTGWVAGTRPKFDHGNQIIMRTDDGGKSWNTVFERDTMCNVYGRLFSRIRDIAVFDDNSGIAVGDIKSHYCDLTSSTVLTTNDGGRSWQAMQNMRDSIYAFHAIDKNNIWLIPQITGGSLRLWNGSLDRFQKKEYGLNVNFSGQGDIFFINSTHGWVAGGNGNIVSTTNGGASWQISNSGFDPNSTCQTMWFTDQLTGWIGGSDLYKTADGGNSWTKQNIQFNANEIHDIQFTSNRNGWLAGDMGIIMRTCNGGSSWITEQGARENFQKIRDIHFINDSTGWGCGDDGTIVSISGTATNTIISRSRNNVPALLVRFQNKNIMISINSPKRNVAFVELLDLHGRRIMKLKTDVLPGNNNISIPAGSKTNGVYIVKYVCANYSIARKITLH